MDPLSFAIQCAIDAGELLIRLFHNPESAPQIKFDQSVVTQADFASDQLISQAIQRNFPDDLILSEELQPDLNLDDQLASRAVWVIDPLDGTTNFSLGIQIWGVLLARMVGGWPEIGVAYFPMLKEIYTAQKGLGAFFNQQPLVIEPGKHRGFSFFTCCSRTYNNYHVGVPYKARIFGSSAYTFCAVARNTAILGFETTPKIWDLAAPWLIVQEAGGVVESFNHVSPLPLRPGIDYSQQVFPTLIACSTKVLDLARKWIHPKAP